MLDKKEFRSIEKELLDYEKKRESFIQLSRDIIRISKKIIYSVHRNEMNEASKYILEIKTMMAKLPNDSSEMGIINVAKYEYVEAICFYEFVKNKRIPTKKELKIDVDAYLLGLADLTGELGRKSVNDSIKKDIKSVILIKEVIEEIYGAFLNFDLRNGELRQKYDSIKWNLKKVEEIIHENSLRR